MSNGGTHQFRHLSVETLFLKKRLKEGGLRGPQDPLPPATPLSSNDNFTPHLPEELLFESASHRGLVLTF